MRRFLASLLALSLAGAFTAGLAGDKKKKNADPGEIGAREVTKGKWNFYSPEREIEMGRELAQEAERTSHLLREPVVVAYVTEVAERVARNSDIRVPVQVRVVDSSEVNAYAFPGGYFFITTGMLMETQSEAELAGVIAHEIAHVAARHATRQLTRAHIWNLMSIPLLFVGGQVAYAVQQGTALMVPLAFLKFSRDSEREADSLGLQYLYASGYDPVAMVDFLERLKSQEKQKQRGITRLFSSHPMTRERVEAAERAIERNLPPREEYVVTTSQHAQMIAYLGKVLREQNRWETDVQPLLRKRTPRSQKSGNGVP